MPRYKVPLKAGVAERLPYPGKSLQILDTGAAASVGLSVLWAGEQDVEDLGQVSRNDGSIDGEQFSGVVLTSAVDTTIDLLVSRRNVKFQDNAAVSATIVGPLPLSVQTNRGQNAGAPLYVSGAVLGDTPAATLTDNAPVPAGPAAAALVAADATRLEMVVYNQGPDPVAIGQAGITWAKRAIVLNAGDTWIEQRGAAKAWQVVTDAAKAANVTVQERKA